MLTNESDPSKIEKAKSLNVAGYIVKATLIPSEVVEEVVKILKTNNK
jgi:AmiR/NasT family two-component response regulator